jgi:hypothetical protein
MANFSALLLVAAVLSTQAGPAFGQVAGRVVDSHGRPLPAVPVELWSGVRRVAVQPTAADGGFRFEKTEAAGALRLSAAMLGYTSVQREVSAPATDLILELTPAVVELERLTVMAAPQLRCPNREDREARDLWRLLYGRYDHTQDTLGISFYTRRYDSTGTSEDIGSADETRMVRSWYGVQGRARRLNLHDTTPYTYGYPIRSSFSAAYAGWMYRDLHSTDVGHFVDEAFGAGHTFSGLARFDNEVAVGFCPARKAWQGPSMQGTLTIGRDTALVRAEWRFRTPKPIQEAGGEVTFVPRGTKLIPLLPAQGLFWRKVDGQRDTYFQRWEEFVTYEFLPPDTLPTRPRKWLPDP